MRSGRATGPARSRPGGADALRAEAKGPSPDSGGGVDRPATVRDTRFSVLEETANKAARGGTPGGFRPPNHLTRTMLTTFRPP